MKPTKLGILVLTWKFYAAVGSPEFLSGCTLLAFNAKRIERLIVIKVTQRRNYQV